MARVTVTVETDPDEEVLDALEEMRQLMATQAEAIQGLTTKVTDIAADFAAFRDAVEADREKLSPAGQAALDEANVKLSELDLAVGDADGSDVPVEPPVDGEPTP